MSSRALEVYRALLLDVLEEAGLTVREEPIGCGGCGATDSLLTLHDCPVEDTPTGAGR